jgi:carboxypeptidase C (cathepsin A)
VAQWYEKENRGTRYTLTNTGGPGSDSMIGLFQELGPCNVTEELESMINPYSWNGVSNLLFLSQPFGVGFSYMTEIEGSISEDWESIVVNATVANVTGRWPMIDPTYIETTDEAAAAAWHVLQGFYSALPQLDSGVPSKEFNLWTESYGGHYGPAFFNHFYEQNEMVANGSQPGIELKMNSLGIINGLIDEYIQAPYYPEMAVNNSYGIKSYNDTVYDFARFAAYMPRVGCLAQIQYCRQNNHTTVADFAVCSEAAAICRDMVESAYYVYGGRGMYDIRHPYSDPTPVDYFAEYLNKPEVQNALGVNLNYTTANDWVYWAFQQTGDFIYDSFIADLEMLLDQGVRVGLFYGDADYVCNWYGGE